MQAPESQARYLRKLDAWVTQIYVYYKDSEADNIIERLVFNFPEQKESRIRWRLEVHREYCSMTIFYSLSPQEINEIKSEQTVEDVSKQITGSPALQNLLDRLTDWKKTFVTRVNQSFLTYLTSFGPRIMENPKGKIYQALIEDINIAVATRRLPKWDDKSSGRKGGSTRHTEFRRFVESTAPRIIADYFGVVAPIDIFLPFAQGSDCDIFPSPASSGFSDSDQDAEGKRRKANALIDNILSDDRMRMRLIRGRDPENIVACYLFDGHFLFLSPMGARMPFEEDSIQLTMGDRSPALFWIFYPSPQGNQSEIGKIERETGRRISRVLYIINVIGTTRIAALHNMKRMKDFSQRLRRLELGALALRENSGEEAIVNSATFRRELMAAESNIKESIIYRSSRTAYYTNIMNGMLRDASIVNIPSWQGLSNFLDRRLEPSLSYLSGLGRRYESLNTLVSNEYTLSLGAQIYKIQKYSDRLLVWLALYYLPHAFENVGKAALAFYDMALDSKSEKVSIYDMTIKEIWNLPELMLSVGVLSVITVVMLRSLRKFIGRRK
jgi:hypothetical protein